MTLSLRYQPTCSSAENVFSGAHLQVWQGRRPVLFIDASEAYEETSTHDRPQHRDVEKIVATYFERRDVEGFAHVASLDEIRTKGYMLDTWAYDDSDRSSHVISIRANHRFIDILEKMIAKADTEMDQHVRNLALRD